MPDKATHPLESIRHTAAITTAAYVTVDAALSSDAGGMDVYNGTDQDIEIAIGAAGAEITLMIAAESQLYQKFALILNKDQRIAAKAFAADTTTGSLIINLWG